MQDYMVIEHIKPGMLEAVYARFRARGRMLPDGLYYVDSWLSADGQQCFQLMQTGDVSLFAQWELNWSELVRFEVIPLGDKPGSTAED